VSPGFAQWKLSFELSPIVLVGGIAAAMPGGMLPIVSLTQAGSFAAGITGGATLPSLDSYFAHFVPMPGASLLEQDIGEYAFANQTVAANAVIQKPLRVSMLMICPAQQSYTVKLGIITALRAALYQHNNTGGVYTVATPWYVYTNCVMKPGMRGVPELDSKQDTPTYQLDFEQPLLTLQAAQQAQNSLMAKISGGSQIAGQPGLSGGQPTVGSPSSQATPPSVPAATGLAGAGAIGPNSLAPGVVAAP
jgi:hypothetical protein